MNYKKTAVRLVLLAICIAIVVAGWWWFAHRGAAADSAGENGGKPAEEQVSALIKTQKIQQKSQQSTLQVYGEVLSGKIISLSFPSPGQIIALQVLPGQAVHRGDTLATLRNDPVAHAGYEQAASSLSFARAELAREEELFRLNMLTQTQLDTARKQLQDAEALLAAQKQLGSDRDTLTLTAPADGFVIALGVAQGDRPAAGTQVVQFGEGKSLRIQLGIEPSQQHLLKVGMAVRLSSIQNPAQLVSAKITEVQNIVDPKTQLMNAIVLINAAANSTLVPGMRIQGTIDLGQQQVWVVPRLAVLDDDKGGYLFQVSQGKAHRIDVVKVSESATLTGITGEIHPDWPLVVQGNYELEDDMAVRESAR